MFAVGRFKAKCFFVGLRDRLVTRGWTLSFDVIDDATYFGFVDISAVNTNQSGSSRWQEQHIAASQQLFSAVSVNDGSRIDFRRHSERDTGREVRLDQAGDDIHRWSLCC